MLRYFRRRRPQHRATISREDINTAHAWGLTLTQWDALTDFDRAECRRLIVTAPRYAA